MTAQTADTLRRWSNLLLAVAQIAVTALSFAFGVSFSQAGGAPSADPPIVPAEYAFTVWSLIYAGCLAYGVYQFAPSRAQHPLLRSTGFFTASGFLGCCCWLLAVRFGHLSWTLPCILWMAASLFTAFAQLWRVDSLSWSLRLCVVAPISIYSGWLSVAIVANWASLVKALSWPPALLGQSSGSILLLLVAAVLATVLLIRSRGNLWYATTILWALAGIGVRNQFELRNNPVAVLAWTLLALYAVLSVQLHVRSGQRIRSQQQSQGYKLLSFSARHPISRR